MYSVAALCHVPSHDLSRVRCDLCVPRVLSLWLWGPHLAVDRTGVAFSG
jgi:hypothetical protein